MKDVTPGAATTKERVRVQAGRAGGPRAEFSPPAQPAPTNLPAPTGPEPTNFLAVIARAAADPRTDVAKMQALLDMQRQIEEREAQKEFNLSFIRLQEDLPAIRQDGKIEIRAKDAAGGRTGTVQQATPYATFNNIMKAIKPLLVRHRFALSFSTEPAGERLLVKGLLEGHGHSRATAFPLPAETSGSKNNVQGWGSSLSYGKRYCTIALLNIVSEAPEDRDTDGHAGKFANAKGGGLAEVPADVQKVSPTQRDELVRRMTDAKISESNFCTKYGVAQVGFLPAALYEAALAAIEHHVEQKREGRANG